MSESVKEILDNIEKEGLAGLDEIPYALRERFSRRCKMGRRKSAREISEA